MDDACRDEQWRSEFGENSFLLEEHSGDAARDLSAVQCKKRCGVKHRPVLYFTGLLGIGMCGYTVKHVYAQQRPKQVDTGNALMSAVVVKECSNTGQDCSKTRCCKTQGFQCFKKNDRWAACRPWCIVGPDPTDKDPLPWNCIVLGPKTPGLAPGPDYGAKPASWVQEKCAATSKDCRKQRCCKDAGKQCFKKDDRWYGCKETCVPGGPDPLDTNNDTWNCTAVGMRTPGPYQGGRKAPWVTKWCSAKDTNCFHTRCCKDAGHQCFLKAAGWAMCMPDCTHGPFLGDANADIWNCTALGGRTPGMARVESLSKYVADWVKTNCSKPGENCNTTMCCADATQQCFSKDTNWATCMRGCKQGTHANDKDKKPWECKKLGPRTPRKWGSPTLYCFSVIRLTSYEADIMMAQVNTDGSVGIFGCDQFDVFAAQGRGWIGDGPEGPVWTEHFQDAPVTRSIDNTAGNTALFRNVWAAVKQVGRWAFTEWTVKVDPDAVLFADRLRQHLRPHTGKPVYIQNCASYTLVQQGGAMMFGAVEAMTREALHKYFNEGGMWRCNKNYQYGEDRWIGECFKEIGAWPVTDPLVLGDKLCVPGVWDCSDQRRAAFHHYKDLGSWMKCYHEGKR
mmetsp:Transcript_117827/g.234743  ORF Transcript_117827/g.234743 Transcript_117827/m.234743 type:complete len:621 (+) Transcript_117827:53-1915(+)